VTARREGNVFQGYSVEELKLVYRVLHGRLTEQPELIDSDLLADLQAHLHFLAVEQGVDPTDHAALDTWLGNKSSCANRVGLRAPLPASDPGRPN
jgi:hypothetical protein